MTTAKPLVVSKERLEELEKRAAERAELDGWTHVETKEFLQILQELRVRREASNGNL